MLIAIKNSNMKLKLKYASAIFFGFISLSLAIQNTNNTLKLVHILFRHGDRTPTETYSNDPYKNYNWADGWGALTSKGKLQLYELGLTLRKHYGSLFDVYSNHSAYIQSSYSDRCQMSAGTLLAALFPPQGYQIWNSDLLWQPVPIQALPRNLDNIVAMKKPCPTYDAALAAAYKSDEITKFNEQNKNLYKYLTLHTGQPVDNITAVEFLFNTLEIEEQNGLILPDWTHSAYNDYMKTIAAKSLAIFTYTDFMKRMKGGVLLKIVTEHMKAKISGTLTPNRNAFLYSGHDISIVNVWRALGFTELIKPEYGAALVFELYNSAEGGEVELLYYNSSSSTEPYKLTLPNCTESCPLHRFVTILEPVLPDNWDEECNFS